MFYLSYTRRQRPQHLLPWREQRPLRADSLEAARAEASETWQGIRKQHGDMVWSSNGVCNPMLETESSEEDRRSVWGWPNPLAPEYKRIYSWNPDVDYRKNRKKK